MITERKWTLKGKANIEWRDNVNKEKVQFEAKKERETVWNDKKIMTNKEVEFKRKDSNLTVWYHFIVTKKKRSTVWS